MIFQLYLTSTGARSLKRISDDESIFCSMLFLRVQVLADKNSSQMGRKSSFLYYLYLKNQKSLELSGFKTSTQVESVNCTIHHVTQDSRGCFNFNGKVELTHKFYLNAFFIFMSNFQVPELDLIQPINCQMTSKDILWCTKH